MTVGSENVDENILIRLSKAIMNTSNYMERLLNDEMLFFNEDEDPENSDGDEIGDTEIYEFGGADAILLDSSILYDRDVLEAHIYNSMDYEDGVTTLRHTWQDEGFCSVAKAIFPNPTGKIRSKRGFTFKGCWNKGLEETLLGYLDTDRVLHLTSDETGTNILFEEITTRGTKPLEISSVKTIMDPLVSAICDTFGNDVVSEVYFVCTNGKPWSRFISRKGATGAVLVLY